MPNLVTNVLHITGPEPEIARFHQEITKYPSQDEEFSLLENILPPPPTALSASWFHQNWGTKWSDFDTQFLLKSEESLTLKFNTADKHCRLGIINISRKYPTLQFILIFDDGDNDLLGGVSITQGEGIRQIDNSYPYFEDEDGDRDYARISLELQSIKSTITSQLKESFNTQVSAPC